MCSVSSKYWSQFFLIFFKALTMYTYPGIYTAAHLFIEFIVCITSMWLFREKKNSIIIALIWLFIAYTYHMALFHHTQCLTVALWSSTDASDWSLTVLYGDAEPRRKTQPKSHVKNVNLVTQNYSMVSDHDKYG